MTAEGRMVTVTSSKSVFTQSITRTCNTINDQYQAKTEPS